MLFLTKSLVMGMYDFADPHSDTYYINEGLYIPDSTATKHSFAIFIEKNNAFRFS